MKVSRGTFQCKCDLKPKKKETKQQQQQQQKKNRSPISTIPNFM